jgi:hypothetical protein
MTRTFGLALSVGRTHTWRVEHDKARCCSAAQRTSERRLVHSFARATPEPCVLTPVVPPAGQACAPCACRADASRWQRTAQVTRARCLSHLCLRLSRVLRAARGETHAVRRCRARGSVRLPGALSAGAVVAGALPPCQPSVLPRRALLLRAGGRL